MNLVELTKALNQLRLGGMAEVLETRILQAQSETMAPIDFLGALVSDELARRSTRLIERRTKLAQFRDPQRTLDNFDFDFNKKSTGVSSSNSLPVTSSRGTRTFSSWVHRAPANPI